MSANDIYNNLLSLGGDAHEKLMPVLREEVRQSIKLNFIHGGRPTKWAPKKRPDNRAVLTGKTGLLQKSINVTIEGDQIKMGSKLVYAPVHNYGLTIKHRGRKLKIKKTKSGKNKNPTVSKPYDVTYPQREFLIVPESDFPRIENNMMLAARIIFGTP